MDKTREAFPADRRCEICKWWSRGAPGYMGTCHEPETERQHQAGLRTHRSRQEWSTCDGFERKPLPPLHGWRL